MRQTFATGGLIITGSITPPLMIEPDEDKLTHAIDPVGAVSVSFSRD